MSRSLKVFWTKQAQDDLRRIIEKINQDRPLVARRIFKNIVKVARTLKKNSRRGRVLPELEHLPGLAFRELIVKPWRLIYRVQSHVEVLGVFDSRRDLDDILFERLIT